MYIVQTELASNGEVQWYTMQKRCNHRLSFDVLLLQNHANDSSNIAVDLVGLPPRLRGPWLYYKSLKLWCSSLEVQTAISASRHSTQDAWKWRYHNRSERYFASWHTLQADIRVHKQNVTAAVTQGISTQNASHREILISTSDYHNYGLFHNFWTHQRLTSL